MATQLLAKRMTQISSGACVIDVTPPTFAGIATLTAQSNGALLATWATATDATNPLSYEVYVQSATATGLFVSTNIAKVTRSLSARVFELFDGTLLQPATTYFVGVRAVDAVGNVDSNIVSLSAISLGVSDESVSSLINAVEQIIGVASQGIVGTVEEDIPLIGSIDDTDAITGTVEDC